MHLGRLFPSVIVGIVGGAVAMMACHFATQGLVPPPDGQDVMNPAQREEVIASMETLPDGAPEAA